MSTPTPVEESSVFENFAGPGGMSEGMRLAGLPEALGVGWDISRDACSTAEKAGHRRIHMSVTDVDPFEAARTFGMPTGYHASPPCPGFSMAGQGKGREDLDLLRAAAESLGAGEKWEHVIAHVRAKQKDQRSALSLEPMRWALALRPEWITMEQVPSVLALWQVYGEVLAKYGYSVWVGKLRAEQYGVPQTRERAVVLASRVLPVRPPTPTHSKFWSRTPAKLDPGVQKWVSMAEAVGWGMVLRPYPTVAAGTKAGGADPQMLGGSGARLIVARERENGDGHWIERPMHPTLGPVSMLGAGLANDQGQRARGYEDPAHTVTGKGTATWRFEDPERMVGFPRRWDGGAGDVVVIDGVEYRARDLRSGEEPAFTVTEKARSWKRYDDGELGDIEHPAMRNNTSEKAGVRDVDEPSPTIYAGGRLNKMTWEESERAAREWRERFGDLEPTHMGDTPNAHGAIRPLGSPAPSMTGSMDNGNFRYIDADRVKDVVAARINNQSGSLFEMDWPAYRPAQVVAGREINTAPGANGNRFNGSSKSRNDGVRVLPEEAAAFQSFREEYPFQGTKTSIFQQIGDAVPPLMAEAMIRAVTWTEQR